MPHVPPSLYADEPKPTGKLICGLPFKQYAALPWPERMELQLRRQTERRERRVRLDERTVELRRSPKRNRK